LAERFRNATDKDIWLMGGGIVARDFLDAGLVDAMTLTVIPVLLGDGIRLFPARSGDAEAWTLVGTKTNKSGALVVRYERAGSVAGARP
jgi:dihydrofolate reductase